MSDPLFASWTFARSGWTVENRLVVAAMTNKQSHDDGRLHPREQWVRIGPLDGEITSGYSDSYVHLGVIGEAGSTAYFDGVTVRQFQ